MRRRLSVFLTLAAILVVGCTKHQDEGGVPNDNYSTVIKDLVGDTSASMAQGGTTAFKSFYFSFSTHNKVVISSGDLATLKWDLAFTGPYNSEVYINNGEAIANPGYGGPGAGAVIVIDKPYDQVSVAPDDANFEVSGITKIGWDAGNGNGWFFYSLNNHICVPVKNRTFILRTPSGKYAKLEILNIYKGNPAVVTDLFWPSPYLTFRYFVQEDGTKNLNTR